MRQQKSDSNPDPERIPTTIHQQEILKAVSYLFHEADASEYVEDINALIGLGIKHVGDPDYIGRVAYNVTRVVTLLVKLGELTKYQREMLLQGGMSETEVYWNS